MNFSLVHHNTKMKIRTSKTEMQRHSFFADLVSGRVNGTESFVPWLVRRSGNDWREPRIRIDFSKIHISPEILNIWKQDERCPNIPKHDHVPGIKMIKKDQHGFEIYLEPGAVYIDDSMAVC